MFQLTADEFTALRSQFATLNSGRGLHRKYLPTAFTEHGAIMASMILNSPRATEVSVFVVRAFVQLRELLNSHHDLALKLQKLENKTELMSVQHDTFEHNTRVQLKQVFAAIRKLMAPPDTGKKRSIGFVTQDDDPAMLKTAGSQQ